MNEKQPLLVDEALPMRDEGGFSLLDIAIALAEGWKLTVLVPLLIGSLVLIAMYIVAPTYTARTIFLPPQPQQSVSAAALGQLGALSGISLGNTRTPGDQYVALLQSTTIQDRLIDHFELMSVYGAKFRVDARRTLAQSVRAEIGKKDGLITLDVDDESPQRAADLANRHVEELRKLVADLALTEAQQRRVFFQKQLKETQDRLTAAQLELQTSGYSAGALRAEPRSAAESYARLKADVTATEVRLQVLRQTLNDSTAEVQQLMALLAARQQQLARAEQSPPVAGGPDYIGKYREFKYQETLFDLFSRQYELARLDESREGVPIQVIDRADAPEKRSKPKRVLTAIQATLISGFVVALFVLLRHRWRSAIRQDDRLAEKVIRLRRALRP